jgi:hypothetical protein
VTGRIAPEPDGTIDLVKADALWAAQTDPSQQRNRHAGEQRRAVTRQRDHVPLDHTDELVY